MSKIRKQWVSWEELNALGVAGGGAYYTKAEFDAFFEGESENKKQVHWDRITSKPGTYPPSAHTLASHSSKAHSELTGVTSDLHHAQLHASAHEVGGGDLVHHDDLTGFEASEHLSLPNTMANVLSSYLLDDLSNTNIGTPENGSLLQYWTSDSKWHDVVDLPPSTHASTHHSGGSDLVNHDSLTGFVAAEHLSLPNTCDNVLSNHNKEVHDSLDIDARYIDGKEVVAATPTDGHVLTYVLANTRWEDKAPAPGTLSGLTDTNIGAPESGELLEYSDVDSKWHNVSLVPWAWADVSKTGSNLTDLATRQHAGLTNITANQHHAQSHTLASHSTKPHSALTDVTANQHHAQSHTLVSHSDFADYLDQAVKQASTPTFAGVVINGGDISIKEAQKIVNADNASAHIQMPVSDITTITNKAFKFYDYVTAKYIQVDIPAGYVSFTTDEAYYNFDKKVKAPTLEGNLHWNNITNEPSEYPPEYHYHVGKDIVSLHLVDKDDVEADDIFNVLPTGNIHGQGNYDWWGTWVVTADANTQATINVLSGADKYLYLLDNSAVGHVEAELSTDAGHPLVTGVIEFEVRMSAKKTTYVDLMKGGTRSMGFEIYDGGVGDRKFWFFNGTTEVELLSSYNILQWYKIRIHFDCVSRAAVIFVDNVFKVRTVLHAGATCDYVDAIRVSTDVTDVIGFGINNLKVFNLTI